MPDQEEELVIPQPISEEDLETLVTYYEEHLSPHAINFLKRKGIEMETAEKYHIGFESSQIGFSANQGKLGGYFMNCLVFPMYDTRGTVVDLIGQPIHEVKPKNKTLLGKNDSFFNQKILEDEEEIMLCRDIFDVLTLEQADIPAVCVPEYNVFREMHADLLKNKRVFICYPNDESSRRESKHIYDMLAGKATEVYVLYLPEGIRNVNALFTEAKEPKKKFVELLRETVEEKIKEPIASDAKNLAVFMEEYCLRHKDEVNGIRTGFAPLDKQLLGGLRGGLYMILGYVSSGKSTLMRQIADQIAEQEIPVVYVTWDMTTFELWARSMARYLQVSPEEVLIGHVDPEQIQAANQEYKKIANCLFTIEGKVDTSLQDIEESVEQITQSLGKEPVIFIDHIQRVPIRDKEGRLTPGNLSVVAYLLHQWSRKWDIPVVVSAPIEQGNAKDLSPTVEASLDVILMLEKDQKKAEQGKENINICVYKNRYGSLGEIPFVFDKEKASFVPSKT
ncbi:DnaB-like helicase C-terminal domain-containing protein [Aneurinibacillus tyrosinisolvens]|uniref:DnaB-like helicase C-terminal domain-containing protein n=1 Tax=Aneurinibacillus tyrosinisolvens TaxID=1443435 RepID=UPI00069B221C|nr:DnaB-like helicase C-terminal domain-containing protein [Aneurinibacillus tyrosinisolvens]